MVCLQYGPGTAKIKILSHRKEYWKFWASFKSVAIHAMSVGAKVFLELPPGCTYLRDPCFKRFFANHGSVCMALLPNIVLLLGSR